VDVLVLEHLAHVPGGVGLVAVLLLHLGQRLAKLFSSMSHRVFSGQPGAGNPPMCAPPWPRMPITAMFTRSFAPSTLPDGYQNAAATVAAPAPLIRSRLVTFEALLIVRSPLVGGKISRRLIRRPYPGKPQRVRRG
jgi:hypothetical protein